MCCTVDHEAGGGSFIGSEEGGDKEMTRRRWFRPALALALVLAFSLSGAPAAWAVVPPNNGFDNATVITSLPFSDSLDTTDATKANDDPDCSGAEDSHTVWYSFTPAADTDVSANTFGSDYDTTLSAYTGTRGALSQVACSDDSADSLQSAILFTASAGVTYHLMVASFDGASGGAMVLSVAVAPPPLRMRITIGPNGSVNADGVARIRGTLTCSRRANPVNLFGSLRQERRTSVTLGYFDVAVRCSAGSQRWRARVVGETGFYRDGRARATVAATFADELRGETTSVSGAGGVTLHRR
jgi:hypothetical protein